MPLNIAALEEARDELKARMVEDAAGVAALDRLIDNAVTPKAKAAAEPVKRRGGRAPKVEVVAAPAIETGAKRTYTKHYEKHGKYSASGGRSPCPACNPRVVTAKEAFA